MKHTIGSRKFLSIIATVISLGWQTSVWSQEAVNLPPRQDTKSGTGVSFKSGSFTLPGTTDLSIGGAGIAGLQLVRSYSSSNSPAISDNTNAQGWTFNSVATISRSPYTYSPDETPPPPQLDLFRQMLQDAQEDGFGTGLGDGPGDGFYPDSEPNFIPMNFVSTLRSKNIPLIYTVSTGSKSVAFKGGTVGNWIPTTGTYMPVTAGTGTLTYTAIGSGDLGSGSYFTFRDTDGSAYIFPWTTHARLQSVTYPDGTKLTFTYVVSEFSTWVTKSIISNRGYALLFDGWTKACIVNLAQTYVTSTSTCPADAQSVSYSYTVSTFNPGVKNLTSATNAIGQATSYSYVGADHLGCVQEPGQTTCSISNTYDVCIPPPDVSSPPANLRYSDKVISQVTGTGESYSYNYQFVGAYTYCSDFTGYGAATTLTAPGNAVTRVDTNGAGMPTYIVDPLGRETSVVYSDQTVILWEAAVPVSEFSPEGDAVFVSYDDRGNPTQRTVRAKPGSSLPDFNAITASFPVTCANPKSCYKPDYIIDANGNRTDYTYDSNHGGVLTATSPAVNGVRPQKRYSYTQLYAWIKNSSGTYSQADSPVWMLTGISECRTQTSCTGTADEIKTTITYGATGTANNLLPTIKSVSSGDGSLVATSTTTYDATGNVLTVDGPLPGGTDTTRYVYDGLRRVVGVIGPDPDGSGPLKSRATRNTFDAAGRLIRVESGTTNGQADNDWAAFVSLESVENDYDVMGRKLKERKLGGGVVYAVTQHSYDSSGRLDCTAVRMDPSQWNSQTNACVPQTGGPYGPDRVTRNVYNAAGERITLKMGVGTDVESNEEISTYTQNGKLATITDGENNTTTYTYNGYDRLNKAAYPDKTTKGVSSSSDYEQFTYDNNGNTTQRRLRDGQIIGFTFDALNRVTNKGLPTGEVDVTTAYDLVGHPVTVTQSGALTLGWDALGRNTSEAGAQGTMTYGYDMAGRRTRTTWPDAFYVTQDYFVTGEVQAIRENGASSGAGVLATYALDNLGRRTSITRGNGTTSNFGYDAVSRLKSLSQDLAGAAQDVTSSFSFNPASQIITWTRNNNSYAWGAHYNVNRAYSVNGLNQLTSDGSAAIGYDNRGNLTSQGSNAYSYTVENRLITGPNSASYSYDPTGRLAQSSGSTGTTRYQYDGTDLVAEYNTSNQLLRRYVHGPGADEPLVWYEGAGTTDRRWLHQDERSSAVAISNSSGSIVAINSYDEYGVPAAGNIGRFQYTGQTWLPEIGMYYYKARVYSPTLGRFLQTDSIGYKDGINWYTYVGNDPMNSTDVARLTPIVFPAKLKS